MSSLEDAQAILSFLQTCFLDTAGHDPSPTPAAAPTPPAEATPTSGAHHLRSPVDKHSQSLRLAAHCSHALQSTAEQGLTSSAALVLSPSGHQSTHDSQPNLSKQLPPAGRDLKHANGSGQQDVNSITAPRQASHIHHADSRVASQTSAWLQQLPWVKCGDAVTAWTASELESQRLRSHSQANTSQNRQMHDIASMPDHAAAGVHVDGLALPERLCTRAQTDPCSDLYHRTMHSQTASVVASDAHTSPTDSQQMPGSVQLPQPSLALDSEPLSASCLAPESESQLESHSESLPISHSDFLPDSHASQGSLEGIWVYPIKSCGGVRVQEWPLGPNGLFLDREWALVGDDGHVLTQKGLPKLALVQPRVNLEQGIMQVCFAGVPLSIDCKPLDMCASHCVIPQHDDCAEVNATWAAPGTDVSIGEEPSQAWMLTSVPGAAHVALAWAQIIVLVLLSSMWVISCRSNGGLATGCMFCSMRYRHGVHNMLQPHVSHRQEYLAQAQTHHLLCRSVLLQCRVTCSYLCLWQALNPDRHQQQICLAVAGCKCAFVLTTSAAVRYRPLT